MYYTIPGTTLYGINDEMIIKDYTGKLYTFEDEELIQIYLYGYPIVRTKDWFLNLALHGPLPKTVEHLVFNVDFYKDIPENHYNGVKEPMFFKRPVYWKEKEYGKVYRVIPNYTNYAVDCYGKVINVNVGNTMKPKRDKDGYYRLMIVKFYKKKVERRVHRFVGLAWVPNPDPYRYRLINHLDGNKSNSYYDNLEWTDRVSNMIHAMQNNQRKGSLSIVTKLYCYLKIQHK
jgi:hypothetical protein